MDTLRLETDRLVLRGLRLDDAAVIRELAGQRDIAITTLNIPHPYPDGAAAEFIKQTQKAMLADTGYTFAITRKPEEHLIGCIGLRLRPDHDCAELGYWMGKPYWSKGYTTEAARRVLQFAFEALGLNRVHASYFIHNRASARVMQKIGMTYEGTLRQHYKRWGEFIDVGVYGILRADYEAQSKTATGGP